MLVVALLLLLLAAPAHADPAVYFSPHGGCTAAVVHELGAVAAYSFTSAPIAKALVDVRQRVGPCWR